MRQSRFATTGLQPGIASWTEYDNESRCWVYRSWGSCEHLPSIWIWIKYWRSCCMWARNFVSFHIEPISMRFLFELVIWGFLLTWFATMIVAFSMAGSWWLNNYQHSNIYWPVCHNHCRAVLSFSWCWERISLGGSTQLRRVESLMFLYMRME